MRRLLACALLLGAVLSARIASAAAGGTVTVNSPVFGATVAVDGKDIGLVPIDAFTVPFGKHTITVKRSGLIDFREQITVKPGAPTVVEAVPPKAMALLTIQTPVRGAEVLIDGKVIGTLPVFEVPIEPGKHRLFVRGAGLQPYQESFLIGPHREHIAKPALKNVDGSVAGGLLDDDLELGVMKPAVAAKGGGLDLDLDLDVPVAPPAKPVAVAAAPPPPKKDALSLDLDLDDDELPPLLEDEVIAPAKPAVAAAAPPAKPAAATTVKPAPASKPAPAAVATNLPKPAASPAQTPAFATDPVAAQEARAAQEPSTPIYKQKWLWAATAVVVVAAVAVPVATGRTGGYKEVRDPTAACPDCLVVMNR